jgi:diguanylate cyclase (GGDEF)-like protein
MSLECQCADDLPLFQDRMDTWLPGLHRWATHPDWRVREWAAWRWRLGVGVVDSNNLMRLIHNGEDPTGLRLPRGQEWDDLGDQFALDSSPAVRAHVLDQPDPSDRSGLQEGVDAAERAVRQGDPVEVSELPWMQRRLAASGHFGPAPRVLLEDPICAIRVDAVRHLGDAHRTPALLAWLRDDPCRWVLTAVRDLVDAGAADRSAESPPELAPEPACWAEGEGTGLAFEDEGQFYGVKEMDSSCHVRCNWCGAADGGYTDEVFDRFPYDHHCDVVPLDGRHIGALAERIGHAMQLRRFEFILREPDLGRIDTQWVQVDDMGESVGYFRSEAARSLLALLMAEGDRNRWTIGFNFNARAAAELQDLMVDFGFTPHDPRTGRRYSDTGQLFLRRPPTLVRKRLEAARPEPIAPDDSQEAQPTQGEDINGVVMVSAIGEVLAATSRAEQLLGPLPVGTPIWQLPGLAPLEELLQDWAAALLRDPTPWITVVTADGETLKVVLSTPRDDEPAGGVLVTVGQEPLIWRATHDRQTGLLARSAIQRILDRWAERARGMAIVLNIDALGRINTQLGYSVGDEVIVHIATLVTSHLPDGGVAARIGGNEFLLLLPDLAPGAAIPTLDRIFDAIRKPVLVSEGKVKVSVSAGCAWVTKWSSPEDANLRAEQALARAKEAGGDTYVIDDPGRR